MGTFSMNVFVVFTLLCQFGSSTQLSINAKRNEWFWALPQEQAHQDDSIDNQTTYKLFQVRFSFLRIRINLDKPKSSGKGTDSLWNLIAIFLT